jgi:hypothetical protein
VALAIAACGAALGFAALASGSVRSPFVEGPFPSMTGGFGEPSCHQCHFDNPVGDPTGHLAVSGVPDAYAAGSEYVLKIALRRPGLSRGGFQVAARVASGPRAGSQAGRLSPADDRVQVVRDPDHPSIDYAQHTTTGTRAAGEGELAWTVRWIAPEWAGDQVVFHVAANAANDDSSPLGDFIYLGEARSVPKAQGPRLRVFDASSRLAEALAKAARPPTSRLRRFVEARRSPGEGGKAQGVP